MAADEQIATPAEATAPDVDPTPGDPVNDTESFSRKYVEDLRKESARYRERAKKYEDVFSNYEDDEQEILLGIARQLLDDPTAGAQEMQRIAQAILNDPTPDREDEQGDPAFLTREEYLQLRQQEKEQERLNQDVAQIQREAREMGYDPDSIDYKILLLVASEREDGDLKAAHEEIGKWREAGLSDYLASKERDADATPTPQVGGAAASGEKRNPRDFTDAKAALQARLDAVMSRTQ